MTKFVEPNDSRHLQKNRTAGRPPSKTSYETNFRIFTNSNPLIFHFMLSQIAQLVHVGLVGAVNLGRIGGERFRERGGHLLQIASVLTGVQAKVAVLQQTGDLACE